MPEQQKTPDDNNEIRYEETQTLIPKLRRVHVAAALVWLGRGAQDMQACPIASLFYGFCFAAMGLSVSAVFEHAYQYTSALTSGFLLLGPFFAMGLYELSRRREKGEGCRFASSLTIWRRNASNIGVFALVLTVVFLVWARASLVMFALFYTNEMPNLSGFLNQVIKLENIEFVAVYIGVGLIFAALVFAISVVAIPMMLDRRADAITSMFTSVAVVAANPAAMLVWAFLIVALTLIGFLTFHIGLIFLMPMIGHGTWHAYRALVEPDNQNRSSTNG
ncbi:MULTISPECIES: DUF2189 domain-containing protein [Niveibacterium]|uniref:DUF2189 domain-containing protein n=1 Tax=Niveibacterium microcysteis TaxID=2811415 RepID=A0ABX7M0Q0_9RHOO|nr:MULTISPECIES: DUF2189 domain-containing protein [Niveibacterium]QSI75339.1 DUF2189 domain-containing protein [Niveibacterium microcysteis]